MVRKIFISTTLAIIFLLFVCIGLLGWYQGKSLPVLGRVVTVPFLEKPAPAVFSEMRTNMGSLQTAKYDLEVILTPVPEQTIKNVKVSALFDGKIGQALLGQLSLSASININNLGYLASSELRFTENNSYVRITEIPAMNFINMAAVKDRWYIFKSADIAGPKGGEWRTVGQSVGSSALVASYERKPDEMIGSQKVYRFDVQLDPAVFSQVLDSTSSALWPGQTREAISEYLSGQQAGTASFWVGKNNLLLYRAAVESHGSRAGLSARLTVSGFNQEIAIEQPGDAEPISAFPRTFFNETNFLDWPLFGYQVGLDLSELTADTDKDGLYEIWETAFGADPRNPDTDHDGYGDGIEVRGGYSPIGSGKLMAGW